jgi:hypothetical protein
MALGLNVCYTATTADCTQFTITDETGIYDIVDNTTGYGAPNEERADLALYLFGYKYREGEDDENITPIINNTDPENVTSWNIANSEDGYYYFDAIAANIWDIAVGYSIDDIVFHQQVWYKALAANTGSEPSDINTNWEVIEDLELEKANTSLVSTYRYDMNYTCRAEICYANVVHDSGAICTECTDCKGQTLQLYMKLDVLMQSMFINMSQDNWQKADKILRTIIGYCSKTDCRVC